MLFRARVAAATTLSQGGLGHSQSSSAVHHPLSGQTQAHSNTQIVHPLQSNSQVSNVKLFSFLYCKHNFYSHFLNFFNLSLKNIRNCIDFF